MAPMTPAPTAWWAPVTVDVGRAGGGANCRLRGDAHASGCWDLHWGWCFVAASARTVTPMTVSLAAPMPVEAAAVPEEAATCYHASVLLTAACSVPQRTVSLAAPMPAEAAAVAEEAATWYHASVPLLLQGTARRPHCWGKLVLVTAAGTGDGGALEEIAEAMAMAGLVSMTEAAAGDRGGGDHGDLGGGF